MQKVVITITSEDGSEGADITLHFDPPFNTGDDTVEVPAAVIAGVRMMESLKAHGKFTEDDEDDAELN